MASLNLSEYKYQTKHLNLTSKKFSFKKKMILDQDGEDGID